MLDLADRLSVLDLAVECYRLSVLDLAGGVLQTECLDLAVECYRLSV